MKEEKKEAQKSQSRYWTEEEHQRFLEAIKSYGHKDVKAIASIVGTRSATQVRTHAQKYFMKLVFLFPPLRLLLYLARSSWTALFTFSQTLRPDLDPQTALQARARKQQDQAAMNGTMNPDREPSENERDAEEAELNQSMETAAAAAAAAGESGTSAAAAAAFVAATNSKQHVGSSACPPNGFKHRMQHQLHALRPYCLQTTTRHLRLTSRCCGLNIGSALVSHSCCFNAGGCQEGQTASQASTDCLCQRFQGEQEATKRPQGRQPWISGVRLVR